MTFDGWAFSDDYSEGVHPDLLAHVIAGNDGQEVGYGNDDPSRRAAAAICRRFGVDADVHFVSGATQANLLTLSAMLRSYQGVVSPSTGHIANFETGAVEATGHKVVTVESPDGRLTPSLIDAALATHEDEHSVMPAVVYLTQATETGLVYSRAELTEVVDHAHDRGLRVFVDGARLATALTSSVAGMSPEDFGSTGVDAFTVGGTKTGGMFGEAIVLVDPTLRVDFRYHVKQRGALMAKGRFLGLQFERFFADDDLWLRIGSAANEKAARLAHGLTSAGVRLLRPPHANLIFASLPESTVKTLRGNHRFESSAPTDGECTVRLVTSWATPAAASDSFLDELASALPG